MVVSHLKQRTKRHRNVSRSGLVGIGIVCAACLAWFWGVSATMAQELPRYTETIATESGEKLTFEMVRLPAGTFQMGSPDSEPGRKPDEGPRHPVKVDSFYLCTTEVTLDLFLAYYQETVSARKDLFEDDETPHLPLIDTDLDAITGPTPVYGELTMGYTKRHPAIGATWYNAMMFCKWLRKKTGKPYRLPTEAEWEYACRAGTEEAYFFGNDPAALGDYAWFDKNSQEEPHAVGQKKPNPWGLYDMAGNVWEWVYDFYSPTAYQAAGSETLVNPLGPKDGKIHVARGGAYSTPAERLRSAARGFREPWWDDNDPQIPTSRWWLPQMDVIGFRVACSLGPLPTNAKPTFKFEPDGQGNFTFDTGVLRGVLNGKARRGGLSSVVHVPSGKRLDGGAGILGCYRVFSANRRYGAAAWDWPGECKVLDDGAVRITWAAANDRPFDLQAVYRWANETAVDVEFTVQAREALPGFEVFLASYFAEGYDWPYVWATGRTRRARGGFLLADRKMGEWLMFPASGAVQALIRDGRWTYPPNPVEWALPGRLQAPMAFRRAATGKLLPAVMAPKTDAFAVATPYRGEAHRSLYLSLFGRDIAAGATKKARARFVALPAGSSGDIIAYYEKYVKEATK